MRIKWRIGLVTRACTKKSKQRQIAVSHNKEEKCIMFRLTCTHQTEHQLEVQITFQLFGITLKLWREPCSFEKF